MIKNSIPYQFELMKNKFNPKTLQEGSVLIVVPSICWNGGMKVELKFISLLDLGCLILLTA